MAVFVLTFVDHGCQLKGHRFSTSSWHNEQDIVPREGGIDGSELMGPKLFQFEHRFQKCLGLIRPRKICGHELVTVLLFSTLQLLFEEIFFLFQFLAALAQRLNLLLDGLDFVFAIVKANIERFGGLHVFIFTGIVLQLDMPN